MKISEQVNNFYALCNDDRIPVSSGTVDHPNDRKWKSTIVILMTLSCLGSIFFNAANAAERTLTVAPEQIKAGQTVTVTGEGFQEGARALVWGGGPYVTGKIKIRGTGIAISNDGNYAYVGESWRGLQVIDINDPLAPFSVGSVKTHRPLNVTVTGSYAYAAELDNGLQVIDISDPIAPTLVSSVETPDRAFAVVIAGNYAYVADNESGLQVIDISDPLAPLLVGSIDTPGRAVNVTVAGLYAYVADANRGLQVIDISDPLAPILIGSIDTPDKASDVAIVGNYAYVADGESGLQIIDISDPRAPKSIASVDTLNDASGIAIKDSFAYVNDEDSLLLIDITNPIKPFKIGSIETDSTVHERFNHVAVSGNFVYVTGINSLIILPSAQWTSTVFNNSNSLEIRVADTLPDGIYDVTILNPDGRLFTSTNSLKISIPEFSPFEQNLSFDEILIGNESPIKIMTLTNSGNADLKIGSLTLIKDFKSVNFSFSSDNCSNAVLAPENSCSFEITFNPIHQGSLSAKINIPNNTFDSLHTIALSGIGLFSPLSVTPEKSEPGQSISIEGEDLQADARIIAWGGGPYIRGSIEVLALDVAIDKHFAYVASGENGLRIFDITDPNLPLEISHVNTLNQAHTVSVSNNYAYVIVGKNEILVVDSNNPASPEVIGMFNTLVDAKHMTIAGDFAYVSDDKTLRVLDISNPRLPVETGSATIGTSVKSVTVTGNIAYLLTSYFGARIIDISNPEEPVEIENHPDAQFWKEVVIDGHSAYVLAKGSNFKIYDISKPESPILLSRIPLAGTKAIAFNNHYVYVGNSTGVTIFDVQNIQTPIRLFHLNIASPYFISSITPYHDVAYIGGNKGGLQILDMTTINIPEIAGSIEMPGDALGIEIVDDTAYVADAGNGLQIIDISNAPTLELIDTIEIESDITDVFTKGGLAFITTKDNVLIFDISHRRKPKMLSKINIDNVQDIAIKAPYAYVVSYFDVKVVDIRNPGTPKIIGTVEMNGYGQLRTAAIADNYAYIIGTELKGETGEDNFYNLQVIDISNPFAPIEVASMGQWSGPVSDIVINGNYAYIPDSDRYLQIIDISNPLEPSLVNRTKTPDTPERITIADGLVYVLGNSFTGYSGLSAFEISNPLAPVLVGSFTTTTNGTFRSNKDATISGQFAYVVNDQGLSVLPAAIQLTASSSNANSLEAVLPVNLTPGTYNLAIFNPDGRVYKQHNAINILSAACPCSFWNDNTIPALITGQDSNAVELGMKFQSNADGYITAVSFYKSPLNIGTHVGSLWNSSGVLLAQETFENETESGWQTAYFYNPVAIEANTQYVVSYHTEVGYYSITQHFFKQTGLRKGPLSLPQDMHNDGHGVYLYGGGGFPTKTWRNSNYWVDVIFTPELNSELLMSRIYR